VLCGATEHASVRAPAEALKGEGFEVETLRLTGGGDLDLEHLAGRLRPDTVLVAQMLVQNEFGSIYPVRDVARLVRARSPSAALHVDAIQAVGKIEVSIGALGADSLSLTAHKIHGPKGAGALVTADAALLRPLAFGGGQEHGLRPGTENVAAIAGLGAAAEIADRTRESTHAALLARREAFVRGAGRIPCARLLEPGRSVSPAIAAVLIPGAPAEVRMHHLEERGVIVSAGSACQSRRNEVSPALTALGLAAEEARCVLRFSFSRSTTLEDVSSALGALETVCRELEEARR
jgi:cysteine desulfurase